jgi:DNA-binding NarL/FixJ family response regulator
MASGLDVPVLVLGPADDSSSMISSVESGALGYADVGASFEDLIAAIRSVVEGIPVIPPLMLGSLLKYVVERQRGQRKARERLDVLSARERQVFELTARGYDKQGVADELFISPATARTHVQNTFQKLNVHSVAELVALAAECGLDLSSINQRSPNE